MTVKGRGDLIVADGPGSKEKKGFAERSQRASPVQAEVLTVGVFGEKAIELIGGVGHSAN
jgi:hypothetical protein